MPSLTEQKLEAALQRALQDIRYLLGVNKKQKEGIEGQKEENERLKSVNERLVAVNKRLKAEKAEQRSEQRSEKIRLRNAVKSLVNAQSASSDQTKATRSNSTSSAAAQEVSAILKEEGTPSAAVGCSRRPEEVMSRPRLIPESPSTPTLGVDRPGSAVSTSSAVSWADMADFYLKSSDEDEDGHDDGHDPKPSLLTLAYGRGNTIRAAASYVKPTSLHVVYSDDEHTGKAAADAAGADNHKKIKPPRLTRDNSFEPLK